MGLHVAAAMQRMLLVLLLTMTALAGCLGGDDALPGMSSENADALTAGEGQPVWVIDGAGNQIDTSEFPGALPEFTMRYVSERMSGEPTLGVTPHGSLVYASIDFDSSLGAATQPKTVFHRSWDEGLSWSDITPNILEMDSHPITGDPYIHVDPDTGRIFAVDMGPNVACNTVSWSDNEGKSWSVPRHGACPLPVSDHPTLFTGPGAGLTDALGNTLGQYPNVVYLCSNQIVQAKCAYSLTGGLDWEPAILVFPGVETTELVADTGSLNWLCSGFTSHATTDRNDGTVYVPRSLCGRPALSVSTDGGLTYEWDYLFEKNSSYETEPGVHDTMVAVDANGTVYYFWLGNQGTTANLVISKDQGATWSEVYNVTAPGLTAVRFPGIAAGADGRIAFQYMGTDNPRGHAVGRDIADNATNRQIWENATWNAYVGISLNAAGDAPTFAITTVNDLSLPLKRGECQDRCPGNGREGGPFDFLDIEIDPVTGQIFTAIVDVCTGFCDEPGSIAGAPQRSFGAVGVQIGGTRLLDGTEYDRP